MRKEEKSRNHLFSAKKRALAEANSAATTAPMTTVPLTTALMTTVPLTTTPMKNGCLAVSLCQIPPPPPQNKSFFWQQAHVSPKITLVLSLRPILKNHSSPGGPFAQGKGQYRFGIDWLDQVARRMMPSLKQRLRCQAGDMPYVFSLIQYLSRSLRVWAGTLTVAG